MKPTFQPGMSLTRQEINLRALPKWALLAFAARCARRVVYLYKPSDAETLPIARVRHALEIAERAATIGKSKEGIYAHGGPQQAYEAFQFLTYDGFNPNDPASCARAAVNGAVDAEMAIAAGETDQANLPANGAVHAAIQAAETLKPDRAEMVVAGICEDYEVLRSARQIAAPPRRMSLPAESAPTSFRAWRGPARRPPGCRASGPSRAIQRPPQMLCGFRPIGNRALCARAFCPVP